MQNTVTKQKIFLFSIAFLLACFGFAMVLWQEELQVSPYDFDNSLVQEQEDCFSIQEYSVTNDSFMLKLIYDDPNEPSYLYEYILLKSTDSDNCYMIPTEIVDRSITNDDGTTEAKKDVVYAVTDAKHIDSSQNYEVYLLNQNDDSEDVIIPLHLETKEVSDGGCEVGSSENSCG